jgi:hypothetical protein
MQDDKDKKADAVADNKAQYTSDAPPPPSLTRDTYDHHSSPQDDVQTPMVPQPTTNISGSARPGTRPVTGTVRTPQMPDHVVKHPEPVGRPKNRNNY